MRVDNPEIMNKDNHIELNSIIVPSSKVKAVNVICNFASGEEMKNPVNGKCTGLCTDSQTVFV